MKPHTTLFQIRRVQDALALMERPEFREFIGAEAQRAEHGTVGVWYRGHANCSWGLVPRVFRKNDENWQDSRGRPDPSRDFYYDEASIVGDFRGLFPSLGYGGPESFDWLCHMQHYGYPTRLLDWTENLLVGLYFASDYTGPHAKCDGSLIALNALCLNAKFVDHHALLDPEGIAAKARILFSSHQYFQDWRTSLLNAYPRLFWDESRGLFRSSLSGKEFPVVSFFPPIALSPRRSNGRIIAQSGTFTLHGNKSYWRSDVKPKHINVPRESHDLRTLAADTSPPLILEFIVPRAKKRKIREQLMWMGIHAGVLFPEVESRAALMRKRWLVPVDRNSP